VSATRQQLVDLTTDPVAFLTSDEPILRRIAVTALSGDQAQQNIELIASMGGDDDATLRCAAAEKLGSCGDQALSILENLENDSDPTVREAVATAYGELGLSNPITWLCDRAVNDPDRQVKEACTSALGAIGDAAAIDTLLELIAKGPPQVRRRAIAAITVFDDDRIEGEIKRVAFDRNPGVREAAEMVVGKQLAQHSVPPSGGTSEPAS
jgi:HEAT repeat protein